MCIDLFDFCEVNFKSLRSTMKNNIIYHFYILRSVLQEQEVSKAQID